ncbi:transmembrane protein 11-B, mitochondrial-like [Bolinopsis microptera]|uniref:transmembrane protein 11-B, mitochondrial-like n=1 Tax=Bolinopsis microptera TaxID=2820187 RepID=UPI00307AC437
MAAVNESDRIKSPSDNDVVPVESYLCEEDHDCVIIHEVFDGQAPLEKGERELDKAMVAKHSTIVIEPHQLGEECMRYIRVGNALHKVCVLSGVTALGVSGFKWSWSIPFSALTVGCAAVYQFSWQHDPACKYQVDTAGHYLHRIPLDQLTASAPIILLRRDDRVRKKLHNTIAGACGILLVYQLFSYATS